MSTVVKQALQVIMNKLITITIIVLTLLTILILTVR